MTQQSTALRPAQRTNNMIAKWEHQLMAHLGGMITWPQLATLILTEFDRNPKLHECSPKSIWGSLVKLSESKLKLGGVRPQAYLVPYKTKGVMTCTLIVSYRGYVDKVLASGKVANIDAAAVHERDKFEFERGLTPKLVHKPAMVNRGEVIGAYAVAFFPDNERPQFDFMNRNEIDAVRKRSKASDDGPWVTDYAEMAKKTVLKRLTKLLPMEVNADVYDAIDEEVDYGATQPGSPAIDVPSEAIEYDDGHQGEAPDDVNQDQAETVDPQKVPAAGTLEEILAQARPQIAAATTNTDLRKIDEFFQHNEVSQLCQARSEEIRSERGQRSNKPTTAGA